MKALKNKGFTLVEMVIAMGVLTIVMAEVAVLLVNSSKLYFNASRETDLQDQAQRVTTVIEEMLVDADVEVSCNTSGSSDILIIKRRENPYEIVENGFAAGATNIKEYKIYMDTTTLASKGYGDLKVLIDGTSNELIAKSLACFNVDMSEYEANSKVNISFKFYDGKYEYGGDGTGGVSSMFSKDYYIRNEIGMATTTPEPDISNNDIELYVLRYQKLSLADETAAKLPLYSLDPSAYFTYEIEGGDPESPGDIYNYVDSNRNFHLDKEHNILTLDDLRVNGNYDFETSNNAGYEPCIINVYLNDGTYCFKVKCNVEKVSIGLSASENTGDLRNWDGITNHYDAKDVSGKRRTGEIVAYTNNNSGESSYITSLVEARGIDLSEAKGFDGTSYTTNVIFDVFVENYSNIGSAVGTTDTLKLGDSTKKNLVMANLDPSYTFASGSRFQNVRLFLRKDINAIAVETELYNVDGGAAPTSLTNFYKTSRLVISGHLYFTDSTGALVSTLNVRAYPVPSGDMQGTIATTNDFVPGEFYDNLKAGAKSY